MIDHTGHPHPSTPKARALCRANGGTGFIGKIGAHAPVAKKSDHGEKVRVPQGPVNTKPSTPKPPAAPPVKKGDAVPKTHGTPKPTTPPKSKPKTPAPPSTKAPTATAINPTVKLTPAKFDKAKMELKDGNGNWRRVGSVEKEPGSRGGNGVRKRAATYRFLDENGKLIRESSPNERLDTRVITSSGPGTALPPPPRISVPPKNLAGTMGTYIPAATSATGTWDYVKIQNALRAGASRDFIKSKSKLPPDRVDQAIDGILQRYQVPNHVYPRVGSGTTRNAATVKPAKTSELQTNLQKLASGGRVEAPDVPESVTLKTVRKRNLQTDQEMKKRADRVLAVQEGIVGDRVLRIKDIKTGIPTTRAYTGHENANGVCLNGHIHIHKDFVSRQENEAWGRLSGFKTRGGDDPLETTLAHEMGHALLTNWDINADHRRVIAESIIKELGLIDPGANGQHGGGWTFNRFEALIKDPRNNPTIKRRVSKYAGTNANEFIAEIWGDYTMNPKPKPHIKAIGDVIKLVVRTLPTQRGGA